jgi:hypothetical protein
VGGGLAEALNNVSSLLARHFKPEAERDAGEEEGDACGAEAEELGDEEVEELVEREAFLAQAVADMEEEAEQDAQEFAAADRARPQPSSTEGGRAGGSGRAGERAATAGVGGTEGVYMKKGRYVSRAHGKFDEGDGYEWDWNQFSREWDCETGKLIGLMVYGLWVRG